MLKSVEKVRITNTPIISIFGLLWLYGHMEKIAEKRVKDSVAKFEETRAEERIQ